MSHLDAEIVLAAGNPSPVDELAAGCLRGVRAEDRYDIGLWEGGMNAVAALEEYVARLDTDAEHIGADDEVVAEAAAQDVTAWMRARLLGREDPVLHLLSYPRMILGELCERVRPEQVKPAVADVRGDQRATGQRTRREGGAHTMQLGDSYPFVADGEVGFLH